MNRYGLLSRASISIGLSLCLFSCSGGEKQPKPGDKPIPLPPAGNHAALAPPAAPQQPKPAAIPQAPPSPPTIRFVPPVVTNEPYDEPPVQDIAHDASTQIGCVDYAPVYERQVPVQEGPLEFVEEMPEYPGGMAALRKYFVDNLVYPPVAKDAGIEGKCYLKFVVSKTGEISNVKVLRGVPGCKECDQEASRLVKAMPPWKPGRQNGKAEDCYFNLPVSFKLQ